MFRLIINNQLIVMYLRKITEMVNIYDVLSVLQNAEFYMEERVYHNN